jgi:hypothetical protein
MHHASLVVLSPQARQAAPSPARSPAAEDAAGSLLHKLLRSEIRRERSHLLQAFRFLSNAGYARAGVLHPGSFAWHVQLCFVCCVS